MSESEMQKPTPRARGRTLTRPQPQNNLNNANRRPGPPPQDQRRTCELESALTETFATNINLAGQQNSLPNQGRESMAFTKKSVPWGYDSIDCMGRGKRKVSRESTLVQPSSSTFRLDEICSAIRSAASNQTTSLSTADIEESLPQTSTPANVQLTNVTKGVPVDHQPPIVAKEPDFRNILKGFPIKPPKFPVMVGANFVSLPSISGVRTMVAPQLRDIPKAVPPSIQLPRVLEVVTSTKPQCPVLPQGTTAAAELSSSQAVSAAASYMQQKSKMKGTTGKVISLQANFFRLCSAEDWVVYRYQVHFQPNKPLISTRKILLKGHQDTLGAFIYNGDVLFSGQVYPNNPMQLVSTRSKDGAKVTISVSRQRQVTAGEGDYTYVLKLLLRKCLSGLKMKLIGTNYYDPSAKKILNIGRRHDCELWPGFMVSIHQSEEDMLLHVDITHKVIRKDTVLDLMNYLWCLRCTDDTVVRSAVQGLEVLTPYNNRTYLICDIDFDMTPTSEFTMRNGKIISFKQYYLEKYETRVSNVSQPILVSKVMSPKGEIDNVYLVPELCQLIGLDKDWCEKDMFLMRFLAEQTNFEPYKHIEKIKQFIQHIATNTPTTEVLKDWHMELKPKLVEFQGRVLPAEKMLLSADGKKAEVTFDWKLHFYGAKMLIPKKLKQWVVMVPVDMLNDCKLFLKRLIEAGHELGLEMDEPEVMVLQNDDASMYARQLHSLLSNSKPQLIVCFTPDKREDRYRAIKRKCSIDYAVPTQIITRKSLDRYWDLPIARRVMIQINCKIGGTPWGVTIPLSDLMVIGVDICEDSLKKGTFHCSLVASINRSCSNFFSATASFSSRQELTRQLCDMYVKALYKYKERNQRKLPLHIVFYRDGVSKKDISKINEQEVAHLKDIMNLVYEERRWSLAFVVVSKHPNTRIFTHSGFNPPPGTVVDNCITRPELYDFYILSGRTHKLTATPTMYIVVSDNTILDPDKMQRLTYKLTHLYYNLKGMVHTPAPVRYAQRLVQQVARHMHKPPHPDLCELLHFL